MTALEHRQSIPRARLPYRIDVDTCIELLMILMAPAFFLAGCTPLHTVRDTPGIKEPSARRRGQGLGTFTVSPLSATLWEGAPARPAFVTDNPCEHSLDRAIRAGLLVSKISLHPFGQSVHHGFCAARGPFDGLGYLAGLSVSMTGSPAGPQAAKRTAPLIWAYPPVVAMRAVEADPRRERDIPTGRGYTEDQPLSLEFEGSPHLDLVHRGVNLRPNPPISEISGAEGGRL
jgi:hypothetical protein